MENPIGNERKEWGWRDVVLSIVDIVKDEGTSNGMGHKDDRGQSQGFVSEGKKPNTSLM